MDSAGDARLISIVPISSAGQWQPWQPTNSFEPAKLKSLIEILHLGQAFNFP